MNKHFPSPFQMTMNISPLWICPETDMGRKNVLVCVNGSEGSYRAADTTARLIEKAEKISLWCCP